MKKLCQQINEIKKATKRAVIRAPVVPLLTKFYRSPTSQPRSQSPIEAAFTNRRVESFGNPSLLASSSYSLLPDTCGFP
jgi:hypothetical protein